MRLQPGYCDASVPKASIYDPVNNPRGVRCTLQDNQYGRDRATGFAPAFVDSAGVQYGLAAFNAGKIGAEQFVARIGGFDVDGNVVPKRSRRRSARVADSLSDRPRELDRIKQDNSNDSAAVKVARNKPAGLVDACWTLEGEKRGAGDI